MERGGLPYGQILNPQVFHLATDKSLLRQRDKVIDLYTFKVKRLTDKPLAVVLHALFLPLFIASTYYATERLIGCGGQDLFRVINSGDFFLIHQRPIHVLSQWLPLVFLKIGFGLKVIVYAFSVGIVLQHYIIFSLIVHWLKDLWTGLAFLMAMLFGVWNSFYVNANLEIHYCISISLLYYGLLNSKRWNNPIALVIQALIIVVVVNSYLPTVSFLVFAHIISRKFFLPQYILHLCAFIVAALLKSYFLDAYVEHVVNFGLLTESSIRPVSDLGLMLFDFFVYRWLEAAVLIALITVLAVYKCWYELFVFTASFLCYSFLVILFYGRHQLEHPLLPLTFFILATFITFLTNETGFKKETVIPFAAVFILLKYVTVLGISGQHYKGESKVLLQLIESNQCHDQNQIIIDDPEISMSLYPLGLYERSLIQSAIKTEGKCLGIMMRDNIFGHFSDLGIHVSDDEKELLKGYSDTELINWLDNKISEVPINHKLLPLKSDGFVIVRRQDFCHNL